MGRISIIILTSIGLIVRVHAGTNGQLEGSVKDKRSGEPLVGVNIFLIEAQLGGTTDVEGRYEIKNVRAGRYDVRFTLIGHRSYVVKNVIINPDLRTKLNVGLEPTELLLDEIVVLQEKPLIQRDITGTTFVVAGEELNLLPIDKIVDVIGLKAGTTIEGNVRGGKTTEVLYLIDGLPVQDVLAGGAAAELPKSSVVGLSIYTGGFEPEYGNALSGVVNIVTKTGTNEHRFSVRGDKDNLFGGTQVSKMNEVEVSASGPIEEDKVYYTGSLNGLFSDTRWWQDFQYFFPTTIDKSVSSFGKIDYVVSPTMRLGTQVLFSYRDWHDYEFNWRFNLDGLPPERRSSYRIAAIFSHTPSENFFYTASLSRFFLSSKIGSGSQQGIPANDPYQYDFFLRYVVDGQRALWSKTTQEIYTARLDGTFTAMEHHLLKIGGEMNLYSVHSDLVKYEPRKTYFGKPLINEPQLNFTSSYAYRPMSGALYLQDKINLAEDGMLVSFGLRYDFLNPTANRPAIEAIPVSDTAYTFKVNETVKAHVKQQLSPRLGAAMQLTENGYLFVNLGWYFQYPLFDFLYTGLDRVALTRGVGALTGNPNLEPERTKSWEISLKYGFAYDIVGSVTYFRKETTNLIDTKTFVPGDSKLAGSFGFAEYVNNPYADAKGFEVVVSRERGDWLLGELSYTYMVAEGSSGSADDGFYIAQYGLPPGGRVFPLSWDQRHSVKAVTTVVTPWLLNMSMVAQWHSGRPYTNYPTSTGFEPIDGGRFYQNNERMPSYVNVDLRIDQTIKPHFWPNAVMVFYLDVRNLLNAKNVKWMDSNGRIGGELGDPSGYSIGRRTSTGVRVEF